MDAEEEGADSWRKNDDDALSKSGLTSWRKSSQRPRSSTLLLLHDIWANLDFFDFSLRLLLFWASNRQGFLIPKVN